MAGTLLISVKVNGFNGWSTVIDTVAVHPVTSSVTVIVWAPTPNPIKLIVGLLCPEITVTPPSVV
ncbi:hypothetical protein D3C72_648420 [compost metagenome]